MPVDVAPYTPATRMQHRKNTFTSEPAAPRLRPQNSPAARKPLYSPWFAAKTLLALAARGVAEYSEPGGFVPEKHLEHKNIDVQERDERDNDVGNRGHGCSFVCRFCQNKLTTAATPVPRVTSPSTTAAARGRA